MADHKELAARLREKLKRVSAGESNTWGFVAMFMDMIDEAEKEVSAIDAAQAKEG